MKVSSLFATFLAGVGIASAANATTVQAQIAVISAYTTLLNNDVLNYNGTIASLPWALQVQEDAVNLYRQVQNATTQSQQSASFGEPGSLQVSLALLNVSNVVKTALSSTAGKATAFGGLGPIVLASLYQLKASTDIFANATIAKLEPLEAGVAPLVVSNLDSAFNQAITAYGGTSKSLLVSPNTNTQFTDKWERSVLNPNLS